MGQNPVLFCNPCMSNTRVQNKKDLFKRDRCQDLNFMNNQTHKFFIFMYRRQIFHEKIIKDHKITTLRFSIITQSAYVKPCKAKEELRVIWRSCVVVSLR